MNIHTIAESYSCGTIMDNLRLQNPAESANFYDPINTTSLYSNKSQIIGKGNKWKKHSGKPKRPLSAYNIFFRNERSKLVQARKKVGFANMAKGISAKWKNLGNEEYKNLAAEAEIEQKKYRLAITAWKAQQELELQSHVISLSPLLANTHPITLQHLLIEQQLMEQQKIMQQQAQNTMKFNATRRMSMPTMGCTFSNEQNSHQTIIQQQVQNTMRFHATQQMSMPTMGCISPNEFPTKSLEQQNSHHKIMQEQAQNTMRFHATRRMSMPTMGCTSSNESPVKSLEQQQQNYPPRQPMLERLFSMPIQSRNTSKTVYPQSEQKSSEVPVGYESSDGTDESSFDEETAELLINMPIFDMEGNDDKQQNNSQTHFIDENSFNGPYEESLLASCNSDAATDKDEQSEVIPDEVCSVISNISYTSAKTIDDIDHILEIFG